MSVESSRGQSKENWSGKSRNKKKQKREKNSTSRLIL